MFYIVHYVMQSATAKESLVGVFCFKPLDRNVDWSLAAKASPCYVTVCYHFNFLQQFLILI